VVREKSPAYVATRTQQEVFRVLIRVQLNLPRDASYVPVTRTVTACLLDGLGVPEDAAGDIQVALTEACVNAVRHATGSSEYFVSLKVGPGGCEVEIIDVGPSFDLRERQEADPEAEAGRGLILMRALVDDFQFLREEDANRVRLIKRFPSTAVLGAIPSSDGVWPPA
jgi:serine/threonine-protein kinase RsbW